MTLEYRKDRKRTMAQAWNAKLINPLFSAWQIPPDLLLNLKRSIALYVARAFDFQYTDDEDEFMRRLDAQRDFRLNVTPNGGVVPKREYQLEYNIFLRSWCECVRAMIAPQPDLLKKFRVTPNIRVKFGTELEENIGRPLDTALPHSDAWVEGPWGMNCHIPVLGDVKNNYLFFYKLLDEEKFSENFLDNASTYNEMQWVLDYYTPDDDLIPLSGHINISDYALLHKTFRRSPCGSRISIDTTIFSGDHAVHPDRENEYMDHVPHIGESLFIRCNRSIHDNVSNKASTFSHYTTGNLERIDLFKEIPQSSTAPKE